MLYWDVQWGKMIQFDANIWFEVILDHFGTFFFGVTVGSFLHRFGIILVFFVVVLTSFCYHFGAFFFACFDFGTFFAHFCVIYVLFSAMWTSPILALCGRAFFELFRFFSVLIPNCLFFPIHFVLCFPFLVCL